MAWLNSGGVVQRNRPGLEGDVGGQGPAGYARHSRERQSARVGVYQKLRPTLTYDVHLTGKLLGDRVAIRMRRFAGR